MATGAPKHFGSAISEENDALDIFSLPATSTSVNSGKWVEYKPIANVDTRPIEFIIRPSPDYIDLSKCYLRFRFKVTQADGNDIDHARVFPVNNMLHTMIKQFSVTLNNTLVTEQSDTYAYRAYLETIVAFPEDAAKSYLTAPGWYIDDDATPEGTIGPIGAGATVNRNLRGIASTSNTNLMDVHDATANTGAGRWNPGAVARQKLVATSSIVSVEGTPAHALFHSKRYLVDNIEMKIRIDMNSDAFALMSTAQNEKIKLVESTFVVRFAKISDKKREEHLKMMTGRGGGRPQPALYPMERGDVQTYVVQDNVRSFEEMDIWQGRVPRRVVAGFVRNDAFTGNYQRNPFNFQLFNLSDIKLLFDGEEYPGPTIYISEGRELDAYNSLFKNSGFMHRGRGIQLSREKWSQGFALFMWDLTPDGSGSAEYFHPNYKGQITLKGNFSAAPGAVLTLVVYGEFVNIMEVDANRVITYDLS